ncbi:MAG: adenylate/guanylate cyclase domain-containing protein [Desulfobaccales bacterium]
MPSKEPPTSTSRRTLWRGPGRALAFGLLVALIMSVVSFLPFGQTLENQALDLWYRLRPVKPPADILIVAVDEPSFQELAKPWPWPRRVHAELVRRLNAQGARLIIFDVIFAGPTNAEDDKLLADAFQEAGNVVIGEAVELARDPRFTRRILISPLKSLQQAARHQGLCTITPDTDGVVRRFRLNLYDRETLPLTAYRLVKPQKPLSPHLSGLIDYAGPARSIDTVSYYQVIDPERPLPSSHIKDRIVLVGHMLEASATPQSQADAFYTPFFSRRGQLMSGVEIQGNILNTLLEGSWGQEPPLWGRLTLLIALILLGSLVLARLKPVSGLILLLASVLLLSAVSLGFFFLARIWIPPLLASAGLVMVYTGNVLGHYVTEVREKRWLRQAFGRYVSPSVVETIIHNPDRLELGGEEVETTVLFSDLEGFTHFSEAMSPQALIQLLNEYFTPMTRIIMAHQGTLDKYIGDALMALWGAPVPLADHALRACQAVLEMERTMTGLQKGWQARGLPRLTARFGLHTGPVVAGNVGSRERFDYTVLGDTVNLASRLEGVNKVYGTRVLLSEETGTRVKDRLLVRELDLVQVKGRSQPVAIYELIGLPPPEGPPAWMAAFAAGLLAYRQCQWPEATRAFEEVLHLKPGDRPAQVFLERCRSLAAAPPPDWQGVFVLDSK